MGIREYRERDYADIETIYSLTKLDELKYELKSFELLPLAQDPKRKALILESNIYVYETEQVVGFGARYNNDIRALFVHPDARGLGIGQQLLHHMLKPISGSASLQVVASNYPAIQLYEKHGFNTVANFEACYNKVTVDVIKMSQRSADI